MMPTPTTTVPQPHILMATAASRAVGTTRNGKEVIVIERVGVDAMNRPRWNEIFYFFAGQAAPWGDPSTLCDLINNGVRPSDEDGPVSTSPWLLIDTAPKDGTRFLVLMAPKDSERFVGLKSSPDDLHLVRWNLERDHWTTDSWDDGGYDAELRPTHWMPLPPLPPEQGTP
jgi:hypothetical protein